MLGRIKALWAPRAVDPPPDNTRLAAAMRLNAQLLQAMQRNTETMKRVAAQTEQFRAMWSEEMGRMVRTNAEDARTIRALLRWCEANNCRPTAAQLAEMTKQ